MTRLGMVMQKGMPFGEWQKLVRSLKEVAGCLQLVIGDAINYGEDNYGSKYLGALEVLCGEAEDKRTWYDTLRIWAYVARNVQMLIRINNPLTFTHYREVAHVLPTEQSKWLGLAVKNQWSVSDLRQAMRRANATQRDEHDLGCGSFQFRSWVFDGVKWFRDQMPAIEKDPERRALLKKDLEPLVEIYNRL